MEQIDQESNLKEIVEWDELEDDSSELVDNVEGTKAHPIRKPLFVIVSLLRLESDETHESWIGNSDEVSEVGLANAKHDEQDSTDKGVLK